jgi:acyl-CoA hydrolase
MHLRMKEVYMNQNDNYKKVSDSIVETVRIVRPNHLNGANRLFGGILMQWIDEVAGIVAKRHAMTNVITASVDNLTFVRGAFQNEMVVIIGKLTWVGTSSMEVLVETYVENIKRERSLINKAYLVMVSIDENDKPVRVPRLMLETEEQKVEWENAEIRHMIRRERKTDGL